MATPNDIPQRKVKDDVTPKPVGPKKPFQRKEHLTQRPFLNPALVSLRDGMQRNVRIKKK